jgi:hypothetical protein
MPVVAYTEWLVDEVIGKNFWFLNPKRVAANLEKQPVIMNESDMILITSRLGQIPDLAI